MQAHLGVGGGVLDVLEQLQHLLQALRRGRQFRQAEGQRAALRRALRQAQPHQQALRQAVRLLVLLHEAQQEVHRALELPDVGIVRHNV
jgi:hypothetical protein